MLGRGQGEADGVCHPQPALSQSSSPWLRRLHPSSGSPGSSLTPLSLSTPNSQPVPLAPPSTYVENLTSQPTVPSPRRFSPPLRWCPPPTPAPSLAPFALSTAAARTTHLKPKWVPSLLCSEPSSGPHFTEVKGQVWTTAQEPSTQHPAAATRPFQSSPIAPTSGPLHLLLPLPGMLFPELPA